MEEDKRILNEEEAANVSGGFASTYKCDKCEAVFDSYKEYMDHFLSEHAPRFQKIEHEDQRGPYIPPQLRC